VIGERLKVARYRARLSTRGLAAKAEVSAMAVSKYERGLDVPGSDVLIRLARALGVKVEFLLRRDSVRLAEASFRCRRVLPAKQKRAVLAEMQDLAERFVQTAGLFGGVVGPDLPSVRVRVAGNAEQAAAALRERWALGQGPIDSLTAAMETHDVLVGPIDADVRFDAATVATEGKPSLPVVVVRRGVPGDRQRFSMAHELGHLVMELGAGVDVEKAAHRFAAALLVPAEAARAELGKERADLAPLELHLLKHKYGLSMRSWVMRAADLGIITSTTAAKLHRAFASRGWLQKEPGDQIPAEEPKRLKLLVLRALAEGLITESRATELLGMSLSGYLRQEKKAHGEFPVGVCN
jgi:Zn-dependent peptidase ImmA (M78 family)/transcriptional regulator with XRE-family HTH domain